jgi:hypothetical protein
MVLRVERKKMYELPSDQTGASIARKAGALKEDNTPKSKIKLKKD